MPSAATVRRHWAALQRRRNRRAWGATPASEPLPVTFPSAVLQTRVHIALGADLTASWLTWNWLDITDRVRHDLGITITAGRQDERGQVTPSRCQLKLDNNDAHLTRTNPMSPYYGLLTLNTPIWIQLDPGSGFADRYHGYVNEWPCTWADQSASDAYVTIQCSGVLRRLGQRTKPLTSALRRTVLANNPTGYWPMDDGSSARSFVSAVGGATWNNLNVIGSDDTLGGSGSSLPTLGIGSGPLNFVPMPTYTDTGRWSVFAVTKPLNASAGNGPTAWGRALDGIQYRLFLLQTELSLSVYDPVLDTLTLTTSVAISDVNNTWWAIQLTSSSATDTVTASLYDTSGTLVATVSAANPGSHAGLADIRISAPDTPGAVLGHVTAVTSATLDLSAFAASYSQAAGGFAGEMAHERILRLCREEGVPAFCLAAESARMGAQNSGGLLALLRGCELADQGVLYEREFGVGFQALSERYNQPVSLELDFAQSHIAGVPQPTDDDQRLVNQFTATRTDGTLPVVAEETTGPLGTGPGGSGVYDDSKTVNVEADADLLGYASWAVHVGTVDEIRWPQIGFHLHANPGLISAWLSAPFGARATVANPLSPMNPATVNANVEGFGERWDEVSWSAVLNTSPASPYQVGVYGPDDRAPLYDSDNSSLGADISSSDASLSVATDARHALWLTGSIAPDFPLDIEIGGEQITVGAISGSTSPQTFTVTRSVNGVVKSHLAGAKVRLWLPGRYAR